MRTRLYGTSVLLLLLFSKTVLAQSNLPSANELLHTTYQKAAAQDKNVFIIFHASWCGWCHKMDTAMNDPDIRSYFEDNYVITHLTVFEFDKKKYADTPGAMELLKQYKAETLGIPFWLIMDKEGKWLADSRIKPEGAGPETNGENTGCPANEKEVNYFISVIRKTSRLKEPELDKIRKRFRQIETH